MGEGKANPQPVWASDHQVEQQARLRLFLKWLIRATIVFITFEALVFLFTGDWPFGAAALACSCWLAALLIGRSEAHRGKMQTAIFIIGVALQLLALVGVLIFPQVQPMLLMLPLLVVVLALPYVTGRPLQRLMVSAWLTAATIAVLSEILPLQSTAPEWVVSAFRASSLTVAFMLLLLLLWLFSSRLNETLRDLRQAHEALIESETRFRATFEQAAVGVAHVAPDGRWLRVNQKLCEIVGYSREELMWLTFQDITYPPDLEADLQQVQQILAGEVTTYSLEKRYVCKNGELTWIQLTVSLVRNKANQPDYFISVIQDINQRKHIEAERDQLYEEAQRALEVRNEFFLLAAHELKTPMTTILGSAQLLQRRLEQTDTITSRERRTAQSLVGQGRRLHRLVVGLLDLSRIQQGTLFINEEVIDTALLSRAMAEELQPALSQHVLDARIPAEPCLIIGDKLRFEEMLQNLLQNAVKYSPNGGMVILEVARQESEVVISVTDQGLGIAEDEKSQIFDRFYRGRNINRQQLSGMGVGLYVVRELVRLHKGSIEVDSKPGQGSTFRVRLPLYEQVGLSPTLEGGTQVQA